MHQANSIEKCKNLTVAVLFIKNLSSFMYAVLLVIHRAHCRVSK